MTNDQQRQYQLFVEATIKFEESVREATQALQHTYADQSGAALKHYYTKRDRIETWRAALLDAYTAALVSQ